ncbi:uncharacterized protein TRAVEDRAFT_57162 [Trametes versicolor FP-101664 SS1]|uniref:uncharacterized protein n=1 Tax=Trametes versicolor (strain FP-101664) TaxID=717944 RepID=UPI0004621FC5|nr:uncharacterized protein TRAVEDRAFT_57162 [Trametes versicolor FP-101664 SS1]EIW62040.1 hypothetical protein TRAVEDRAFT_57162 [Trametes versicolor FP-101664 SS1]
MTALPATQGARTRGTWSSTSTLCAAGSMEWAPRNSDDGDRRARARVPNVSAADDGHVRRHRQYSVALTTDDAVPTSPVAPRESSAAVSTKDYDVLRPPPCNAPPSPALIVARLRLACTTCNEEGGGARDIYSASTGSTYRRESSHRRAAS